MEQAKRFYTKKAEEHFLKYQLAVEAENEGAQHYHMTEYQIYKKAANKVRL